MNDLVIQDQWMSNSDMFENRFPYIEGLNDDQYCRLAVKDWINRGLTSQLLFKKKINIGCAKGIKKPDVFIKCTVF